MSHYKPYPAYKDSGVEWLEKVPEHWEVTPLKYEAEFVNGAAFKPEQWAETGTPIIRIENLNGSLSFNCFEGEMDFRYHVEKGDLLFGWSGNRGTSFGPFIWPHEGQYYLNQHIFRICKFNFDRRWFYWSLKAVTAHVEDQAHGIIGMVHITKGDLGSIKIAAPTLAEQQAIAVHLDRETARIDALVEKKTRFIELLREKRQALITHAVTKGLDPNVKMKDSGVEWLGEVPEHWGVKPFKFWIGSIESGKSVNATDVSAEDGEISVLKTSCVYSGEFDVNQNKVVVPEEVDLVTCPLRANSLIVSRMNTPDLVGAAGLVMEERKGVFLPDRLWQVTLNGLLPEFAHLWTRSSIYRHQVKTVCAGTSSSMQNIAQEQFGGFLICSPSAEEQGYIVRVLNKRLVRIDALTSKTESSIELLKERRSALITAAVTGQIDLREAA